MRYEVLDSWRGVCATIVALMHFNGLHHLWGLPLLRNSYLFVDFFFVLSGFVISHAYAVRIDSSAEALRFMVRRVGRVWPLHMALLALYIAAELGKLVLIHVGGFEAGLGAFEPGGRADLATLPSQVVLTHGLGIHDGLTWNLPSWSISVEFWTYALFAAVCVTFLAGNSRLGILLLLSAIALVGLIRWSPDAMFATYDLGFPRAVIGFTAGYIVWRLRENVRLSEHAGSLMTSWMELAVIALVAAFVWVAGVSTLSFLAPVVFAAAVYVFSFEGGSFSRLLRLTPFQKLGLWSYSIYMVHDLIIYILNQAVSVASRFLNVSVWQTEIANDESIRVWSMSNQFALDALALVYLVAVFAVSALTYRFIEEPARRWFNEFSNWLVPQPTG